MKSFAPFIWLLLAALFVASCSSETEEPDIDFGYEYFPVTIGLTNTYQVDSTVYNLFADTVFTRSWEVQETIVSEDVDGEDRPRYRIEQRRRQDNSAWSGLTPTIWYAVRTDQVAERLEDNLRFLKIVFLQRKVSNGLVIRILIPKTNCS